MGTVGGSVWLVGFFFLFLGFLFWCFLAAPLARSAPLAAPFSSASSSESSPAASSSCAGLPALPLALAASETVGRLVRCALYLCYTLQQNIGRTFELLESFLGDLGGHVGVDRVMQRRLNWQEKMARPVTVAPKIHPATHGMERLPMWGSSFTSTNISLLRLQNSSLILDSMSKSFLLFESSVLNR